jgi:hypothetical protein
MFTMNPIHVRKYVRAMIPILGGDDTIELQI